ncbi:PorT family protein [Bacteroides sp. 214]|uniref:outer membrane beta-barrel protein n=1 Tax=Bacteroides sp. 214 TaxID=2302935 RepID=UPI0013D1869E|nr:outer membrane beta-barrel protein [Bacteroides sp. 214]NDW13754.1 PorT family protein [Bacteroides sp. 214]
MKKSIITTFVLLLTIFPALQAQETYIIKNDTLVTGLNLILASGRKKYHEVIEEKRKNNVLKIYTPNIISEFHTDNKTFVSMSSPVDGEEQKVFLYQLVKRDSITVYQYANKEKNYLFFRKNEGELKEITAQNNPYSTYINEKYEGNSTHPINSYQIRPTPQSIRFAEKLIYTQNRNLLSHIRYGIWIGGGISTISKSTIPKENTNTHLFAGLFLNIPVYTYFSVHSEISFMQEAYSYHYKSSETIDKTFNRKSLFMPIMLRYSFNKIKGNFIPYIQAGPSTHFALKQKEEKQFLSISDENASIEELPVSEKSNFFYSGISSGTGLEYKLSSQHSVFLDVRYIHTFITNNNNIIYVTISVNL